jgi:hypothetical protein
MICFYRNTYSPLLKRKQLTCAAWVESLNTCDDGRGGGTYRSCEKRTSLSLHELFSTCRLLPVFFSFIKLLKSNLCRTLTTQNTTDKNCNISHAQNTTALQPNVFLVGIHPLLFTNKGGPSFSTADNCQGQLNTPQSVLAEETIYNIYFEYEYCDGVL